MYKTFNTTKKVTTISKIDFINYTIRFEGSQVRMDKAATMDLTKLCNAEVRDCDGNYIGEAAHFILDPENQLHEVIVKRASFGGAGN